MKKRLWLLAASIIQLLIGAMAIAAFALLAVKGEDIGKWIPALFPAAAFVILGITGIRSYK